MIEKMTFKPRARLLLQLGDELIRNESIALLELVKNSYDADSTVVNVKMENVDHRDGTIMVEDNGIGMDVNVIKRVWMEPGSTSKQETLRGKRRTEKFGRTVLGEKGIGRFAVHKLGDSIELITRKAGQQEVYLKIDWTVFEESEYLEDTPISVEERTPRIFLGNKTGTRIIITKLRKPWNRGMVREVHRAWNALCSPFETPESFSIKLNIDKNEWLEGIMKLEDIKEHALYKFNCIMEGSTITKFEYEFMPYPTMNKLRSRTLTEKNELVKKLINIVDFDGLPVDLNRYQIGTIIFEGYIFDRDPRILSLGVQDKKGFKEYLDTNGGIKVYRDGMRVYDYGEPGNDWLNLDIRRVNVPTVRISNNIIIAAASLNRQQSYDLIEKTNREGFIENEAYNTFVDAILHALHVVEVQRITDKNQIRTYYGASQRTEPVISKIGELKRTVEEKIRDKPLKEEVIDYLEKIESDYNTINETLLKSAGAGLSLSVVIHEAEKIVSELEKVLVKEGSSSRISALVKHLSELLEGYAVIIRTSGKKQCDVKDLIEQAVFNMEYRLHAHSIEIIKDPSIGKNFHVKCAKNLIVSSILNILDNSIWWLDYGKIPKKKIFITVSDDFNGYTTLVIADNGNGFALPTEEITKPFVTAKPDGMGLGLHIAKEVMEAHGGQILFPDFGDFPLPKEFKKGAIVGLAFKKEDKK